MAPKTSTDNNLPKPKRPLSAYNLFYRFKRAKIVEAGNSNNDSGANNDNDKQAVCQLVATAAGLENYPSSVRSMIPPDRLDEFRRTNIRLALGQDLFSKDTRNRPHRKSKNGGFKLSFVEMNRLMVGSWKAEEKFTKAVFQELAEEARKLYQQQLIEHSIAHHMNFTRGSTATTSSNQEDIPKVKSQELDFFTPAKIASSISAETKASNTASIQLTGPVTISEFDLAWEPLPFANEELARNETRLSSSESHTLQKAVPPSPNAMHNVYQPPSHTLSHTQGAAPYYTSPVCSKPCYPVIVTPVSRHGTSSDPFNCSTSPVNSSAASTTPRFLPPPFLYSNNNSKASSCFGPSSSSWNAASAAKPTVADSSLHANDCFGLGEMRSPGHSLLPSFVPPPFAKGCSEDSDSDDAISCNLGVSSDGVSVDDFAELIALLGDDP